jgi:hypothetical protein
MSDPTDPKPWYLSKTVWLGVLTTVAGVAVYFSDPAHTPALTSSSIALAAVGVVNVLLRVWFTAAPIAGTRLAAAALVARARAINTAVMARSGSAATGGTRP